MQSSTQQQSRTFDRTEPRATIRRRFHPEVEFGDFTELDGSVRFYARIRELLPPDGVALDIGCGRGAYGEDPVKIRRELRILRGHCGQVIGIDPDPAAVSNEFVDDFRPLVAGAPWPVLDASVDLAVADFVLEHVADSGLFFTEAARVLKRGGYLCLRTINANSYVGLASRLVPVRLHASALGRAQPERHARDVFPTIYPCNTQRRLRDAIADHGFDGVVLAVEDEPEYLTFNSVAYRLGLLHRRLAPASLRTGLVAFARRA